MSDTELILQALKEHREETRQDMHELRQATVKIADAAADMGKTMARSEERHAKHEDAVKRMGRQMDDHETRIRVLENTSPSAEKVRQHAEDIETIKTQLTAGKSSVSGGWKVLTILGALLLGSVAVAGLVLRALA